MASSSSKDRHKRNVASKSTEVDEIVRYMSHLPSYLERGKPIQDRALNFGVMDWGRLEQWQYHQRTQGVTGTSNHSPSGNKSSKGQSSNVTTLQSHLNISPAEISPKSSLRNLEKSQNSKDAKFDHRVQEIKKSTNRSRPKSKDLKMNDVYHQNPPESKSSDDLESFKTASSSSSKGKMKIEDDLVNEIGYIQHSKLEKEFYVSSKNSDSKISTDTGGKQRNISPRRRFSFSISSKSATPKSATKTVESPPVSQNSTTDNTSVPHRTNSSPLKRLLEPLFTATEDSKIKSKVKLDLKTCKEVKVDNSYRNKSSTKQALFQVAVKNGRPLFTFAVENNNDILAATVRSLSEKDDANTWIYTFFTVQEVKKKKGGWLSHNTKSTNHAYLPNVTAQMTVSNRSISNCREFVLSSMEDLHPTGHGDAQQENELAAIVVRFFEKEGEEENQDCFSTTVILPGGHHSVPRKGEPSPLIKRWKSGGVCDCGGWDVGCRLRTFTNIVQSDTRSNLPDAHMTSGKFELFFQGDVINERPFFSFSLLKEGICSVEYNSSLSLLQAFSICISVVECRKSSQHTVLRTYVAKQVDENVDDDDDDKDDDDDTPVVYASLPPVSPVGRV